MTPPSRQATQPHPAISRQGRPHGAILCRSNQSLKTDRGTRWRACHGFEAHSGRPQRERPQGRDRTLGQSPGESERETARFPGTVQRVARAAILRARLLRMLRETNRR